MNTKSSLLRASALAFILSHASLQAAVITTVFDNLQTPSNQLPVNSAVWWGQSFRVDTSFTVTEVVLSMGETEESPGDFFVHIYNAAGVDNRPRDFVIDLVVTANPSEANEYTFLPSAPMLLDAGNYYVVAGASGAGSSELAKYFWNAEAPSDVGSDSTIGYSNGDPSDPDHPVWTAPENDSFAFNMQVNVEVVPEPANMALGIFGVFFIGLQSFRWWNARRRQIDPLASR